LGAKQRAAFGHGKIASKPLLLRGLNVLAATVSTPLAACRRNGEYFSVTVRMGPKAEQAITGIADDAWTAINDVNDDATGTWISDPRSPKCPTPRSTPRPHTAPKAA
jgi:hypothetical protein